MRLLAIQHMATPLHNAGGETTVQTAYRGMVQRGHAVHVICRPHGSEIQFDDYEHEGVSVVRPRATPGNEYLWMKGYVEQFQPDLLLTHLDLTFTAMQLALDTGLPLAHFVHNSAQLDYHRVGVHRCQLAIFNSEWIARAQQWQGPQIVVHPIVEPHRYTCERGTKITLVNPTPGKGESTFYQLSRLMPDYEFLVVKSVYGEQVFPPAINADNFPNVEFMQHTADIREVFRKTRVLLMPSDYESYGRVAVEAACAGIPTIAHPTEGLLEALADESPVDLVAFTRALLKRYPVETPERLSGGWVSGAGIFCDRNDLSSWRQQLTRLYSDDVYYRSRVDAALKLAAALQPDEEFDRLEQALLDTCVRPTENQAMKMWTSDSFIWLLQDGSYRKTDSQRIPADAVKLFAGKGTEIPDEVAAKHGWKSIDGPVENKALSAPAENKTARKKTA